MSRFWALLAFLGFSCLFASCLKNNYIHSPLNLNAHEQYPSQVNRNSDNPNANEKLDNTGNLSKIITDFQSLLERHPDFDLSKEKAKLQSFKSSNFIIQAFQQANFKIQLKNLENELMHKVLQPNGENLPVLDILDYKTFTPNGFKNLYENLKREHLEYIRIPPAISGDQQVDDHIRSMAIIRGYQLRPKTDASKLVKVDGVYLQPETAEAYRNLKNEALKSGMKLGILSGFRSVETQRNYFLMVFKQASMRNLGRTYTKAEILSGKADSLLSSILETTSIPGYSKHHSGYAVDFIETNSNTQLVGFASTPLHPWLTTFNYYNAKRFGFIPSYPEGATAQGPLPEPWEYVWVGTEVLKR